MNISKDNGASPESGAEAPPAQEKTSGVVRTMQTRVTVATGHKEKMIEGVDLW